MRTAMRSCRNVFWAVPLAAALLLAGCAGGLPWSQTQASRLEHVSSTTFDERVLKCEGPVLVDFYAEWCGPCKKLGPVLEDFAEEHPEIRVVNVNVDENPDLAGRYEVKSIPCLLVIRGGQVTSRSVGLVAKGNLVQMTQEKLKETPAL